MGEITRGPWVYAPTGDVMRGYSQPFGIAEIGKANLVAGVFGDVKGGEPTAEANARLIAASPTMYDALKRVVAQYEDRCGDHCSNACVICQAKAALQKAEGAQ